MSKQILISLITNDLAKSTAFYSAIGFTNLSEFSNNQASNMLWSEDISFMLLSQDLAKTLNNRNKQFVNQKQTVSAVFTLICQSREEVDQFCTNAKKSGGKVYDDPQVENSMMYSFEVEDPDGYILQPTFFGN
jgi:uncharacterized protein